MSPENTPNNNPEEAQGAPTPEVDAAAEHEQQQAQNPEAENQSPDITEAQTATGGIRAAAKERLHAHRLKRAAKKVENALQTEAEMDRKDEVYEITANRATTPHLRDEKPRDVEKSMTLPEKARAWYVRRKAEKKDRADTRAIETRRVYGPDRTTRVSSVRRSVTDSLLHMTIGTRKPDTSPAEAVYENTKQVIFTSPIVYNEKTNNSTPAEIAATTTKKPSKDPSSIDDIVVIDKNGVGHRPDDGKFVSKYEMGQIKEHQDLIRAGEQHAGVALLNRAEAQKLNKKIGQNANALRNEREAAQVQLNARELAASTKAGKEYTVVTINDDSQDKREQKAAMIKLQAQHGLVRIVSEESTENGTVFKLKTLGLTNGGRLWERFVNNWHHVTGDRPPQDYADTKMAIKSAPKHHSNTEYRRVRRAQQRREESLNYAAGQPVLQWWRNRRRESARKKREKNQDFIDRNSGVHA